MWKLTNWSIVKQRDVCFGLLMLHWSNPNVKTLRSSASACKNETGSEVLIGTFYIWRSATVKGSVPIAAHVTMWSEISTSVSSGGEALNSWWKHQVYLWVQLMCVSTNSCNVTPSLKLCWRWDTKVTGADTGTEPKTSWPVQTCSVFQKINI